MEYLVDHGDHPDLPLDTIVAELRATYPQMVDRVGASEDAGFA